MPSIRSILLFGLPLVSTGLAQELEDFTSVGKWEEVVDSLPGQSLRAALQGNIHQYREGVFEDGRDAIDAVRSEDPTLAAALVDLAKQDAVVKDHLRKRQATNTTTPSASAETPESTSSILVSSTPSSTIEPTPTSEPPASTQGQSSSSVPESSSPVESSTSEILVVTTPSSTSSQIVALSTSLISVPASSSTVSEPSTAAEPSTSSSSAEPTSTTQGQTSPTIVVLPSVSTGLPSTSSSQEQSSPSVVVNPTTPTSTAVVPVTTPTSTAPPETTEPSTTAPAPTTQSTTPTPQDPTTQAPTTEAPPTPPTSNVFVDTEGSIVTSVPPLFTATESDGDTIVLTSPTPGGVYTTEDQAGDVAVVTYTPGGGTVSQILFLTTTLPNGSPSVMTSFQTVAPPEPTSDGASGSEGGDDATLQEGAAAPSTWHSAEIALILCAAVGVADVVW